MQFQGKLMIQTQENGKKPNFGPNLSPLNRNSSRQFFFAKILLRQSLDIMVSYHHVQYHKKLMRSSRRKSGVAIFRVPHLKAMINGILTGGKAS